MGAGGIQCTRCRNPLGREDFEERRAFSLGPRCWCLACVVELIPTIRNEETKRKLMEMVHGTGNPESGAESIPEGQRPEIRPPEKLKDLERIFVAAARNRASDIHLKVDQKPTFRIHTVLYKAGERVLASGEIARMIREIMTDEQAETLRREMGCDFAYSIPGVGRFRIHVFNERGRLSLAARRVNTTIPSFEELRLPLSLKKIGDFEEGLVIVAGPTGSGKSTTLACLLDYINTKKRKRIVTIEDPIEYLFQDKNSFVSQREIGIDVPDFHHALRDVVRQDPDVILLGEMRDAESFEAVLQAAETGHLVFTTVHAWSVGQTIGRLLDLFPADRQPMIRQNLAFNLRALLCQKLVPSHVEGVRVVPAMEILFVNAYARKLILEKEDRKLQELIRGSREEGMQDLNMSLIDLIHAGLITKKAAIQSSPNPEQLKMNLQGIYLSDSSGIMG